ncbi:hypothetical protein TDB9533_00950 [Thalassocella blandensis]|nr:hypothetical protein TDB9533_00950 [Thalassocella blandensis]
MKMHFYKQQGVGLIELLISITIGIMILGGVLQLYATSRSNTNLNLGQMVIQDNVRYIMSQMESDIAQAGNLGCFSLAFRKSENFVGDILTQDNVDDATAGIKRYDTSKMIDGTNDDGTLSTDTVLFRFSPSYAGIPVLNYDQTGATPDQLSLDLSTPIAKERFKAIDQWDVLLAADCSGAIYFMVTNDPTDTPGNSEVLEFKANDPAPTGHINAGQKNRILTGFTTAKLEDENNVSDYEDNVIVGNWNGDNTGLTTSTRPYVYSTSTSKAVIYRIGDSLAAGDDGASCTAATPEYCALLRDDQEIADGVEDFQVEYGWHVDGAEDGTLSFGDASQVPAAQWINVDRIRISMTLNSGPASGGDPVQRSYVRTVALRNQIGN